MSHLSVLVVSCDRYADLWPTFFALFSKYWSDCPYPLFLGSNRQVYDDPKVKMVLAGDDFGWAFSTRRIVEQVPGEYILLLLEDFLLIRPVDTGLVRRCLEALMRLDGGYLRLKPFPKPDVPVPGYPDIGIIERGAPYRASLQAAIWRRDVLLSLMKDGETAWDMEIHGSRRTDALEAGFYSTWEPVLAYRAGVTFGKWVPSMVDLCRKEGAPVDLSARPVMTRSEYRKWRRRVWLQDLFIRIPWIRRRPVGNLLRALKLLPPRADGI